MLILEGGDGMHNQNEEVYDSMYQCGRYSLANMMSFVDSGEITPEEFHYITGYSYYSLLASQANLGVF